MSLPDHPAAAPARLVRRPERGWLGGVCSGIADSLGISPLVLRTVFVLLASWRLTGVVAYFLVWLIIPLVGERHDAPGLDANTRAGLRTVDVFERKLTATDAAEVVGFALVGAGALWLVQANGWGLTGYWLFASALLAGGMALVWWQADHASVSGIRASDGPLAWLTPLLRHWTTVLALGVGLAAIAAWVVLAAVRAPVGDVARTLTGVALGLAALAAASAPWVLRVRRSLTAAREAKLIADARADMAAHLHDSVLQTLALIQKQASNAREVTRLARRQERELRAWLYGNEVTHDTLAAALKDAVGEVEDTFPINVELVAVGDIEMSPALGELVKAAREAMTNAAKHSGTDLVDVYSEVYGREVAVFVRDRGKGFDLDAIADDRMGVRHSILERLERHGGTARVRSNPETGTEVTLEMTV